MYRQSSQVLNGSVITEYTSPAQLDVKVLNPYIAMRAQYLTPQDACALTLQTLALSQDFSQKEHMCSPLDYLYNS